MKVNPSGLNRTNLTAVQAQANFKQALMIENFYELQKYSSFFALTYSLESVKHCSYSSKTCNEILYLTTFDTETSFFRVETVSTVMVYLFL